MIAAIGYGGILLALASAVVLAGRGFFAGRKTVPVTAGLRGPVIGLLGGALIAGIALEVAILSHDFSIAYVAGNTATATPFIFLLAAGWAALEGSVVLWGIVLALFTFLVWRTTRDGDGLGAGALGVMGAVAIFWFGLMATAANPFALCTEVVEGVCSATSSLPIGSAVAPADGLGPNPLLQNHILMAVHPPMLYLGYVGFTVPFAFAISALARAERGSAWLDRTHRWSLVAWSFLTLGIVLGAWWSYEVLGWGGYWAWDPVENAALLPWLAATAFIHSAVVQRRRGMLQSWNFLLIIATFALTILGTFLTRSGIIASVHSFTQSAIGPAILIFLAIVVVTSLLLFAFRAHLVASAPRLESLVSREGALLLNNLLLTLFAFTVFIGTMYPLLIEAYSGRQVSVGRPFFDRVAVAISFALLLAIGIGVVAPWRVAKPRLLWERLWTPIRIGLVAGAAAVLLGVGSIGVVLVVVLSTFVIATILRWLWVQVRRARGRTKAWGRALWSVIAGDRGYWGGQLSHIGLALVAIAIATTSALAVRQEVRLARGESAVVAGYCVRYESYSSRAEPQRSVEEIRLALLGRNCSDRISTLQPRIHRYPNAAQPIGTPDVRTGLIDDVYASIAGGNAEQIAVDVFVFPFMWLLWVGGLLTVAGGIWAVTRRWVRPQVQAPPERVGAGRG